MHRLIQNQTDGKLVELPSLGSGNSDGSVDGKGREGPDSAAAEAQAKTEKMAQEFSNLLISQLESQRNYFLEKMSELKQELLMYSDNEEQWRLECEVQEKRLDKARSDLDILLAEKEDAQKALEQMEKATIAELRRDRERLEKKLDKSQEATRASQKDLAVERGISRSSTERMKECQQKLIEKEAACEEHMKEVSACFVSF